MKSMGLDSIEKNAFNTKSEDTCEVSMSLTMATLHQFTTYLTLD